MLRALGELPPPAPDAETAGRARREARAAFTRSFEDVPWHVRVLGGASRAVVPVALAGIVGVYLTWAIATASSFVGH